MEVTNPAPEVAEVSEAQAAEYFDKLMAEPPETEEELGEADEGEATEDEGEEAVETDQAAEPEADEVEWEGQKYKLPTKIAEVVKKQDALQRDYTQKTQLAAERTRVVEDRMQFVEAAEQLLSQAQTETAEVLSIQKQLKQFEGLDWQTVLASDPNQGLQLLVSQNQLKARLEEAQKTANGKIQHLMRAKQMHEAKQEELGRAELQRRVGALSAEQVNNLKAVAQELGFGLAEHKSAAALHAAWLAMKYMNLQKGKGAVDKKVAQAKPMKPVSRSSQQRDGGLLELQDRVKKTGSEHDAAAYFERKFSRK